MTEQNDQALTELLRVDMPPERDALFRLAVLERRERRRFHRRLVSMMTLTLIIVAIAIFGMDLPAAQMQGPGLLILMLGAAVAGLFHASILVHLRWLFRFWS